LEVLSKFNKQISQDKACAVLQLKVQNSHACLNRLACVSIQVSSDIKMGLLQI